MSSRVIHFNREDLSFTKELNRRVNDYFKSKGISRYANTTMKVKTAVMLGLYLVPYFLIISNILPTIYLYPLFFVMGFGIAGIGFSIMHDACHGAYSRNKLVNKILGYSLNLVGGNATNWKIQHNVLHHTYTNVIDHDDDISPRGLFRFTPHTELKKVHRYQRYYAWFFYSLMSLLWVVFKDFRQLRGYGKEGLLKKVGVSPLRAWTWLIFTKLFYIGYFVVLPVMITDYSAGTMISGILISHLIAGFLLAIVFQPAHVVEGVDFPLQDDSGKIEEEWTVHQMKTTADFSRKNNLFSYYVGGLNYQVEHHLFPTICHVHYYDISSIVKETAEEFGVPYYYHGNFANALKSHYKLLKTLGQAA